MDDQLSLCFTCECNNKSYPSQLSLKNHQKTKSHQQWMGINELKQLKVSLTEKENVILKLNLDIQNLKELNNLLIKRTYFSLHQ